MNALLFTYYCLIFCSSILLTRWVYGSEGTALFLWTGILGRSVESWVVGLVTNLQSWVERAISKANVFRKWEEVSCGINPKRVTCFGFPVQILLALPTRFCTLFHRKGYRSPLIIQTHSELISRLRLRGSGDLIPSKCPAYYVGRNGLS